MVAQPPKKIYNLSMKSAAKTFFIFAALAVVISGILLIKNPSNKETQNPLDSMKNMVNQGAPGAARPDIRPATPAEVGRPTLLDKLKQLTKPKEKNQENAPMQLFGPVKDRKILSAFFPVTPQWVNEKGLESEVVLWFHVLPKGTIKDDISVSRSSGYKDLDDLAIRALKDWAFYPAQDMQEQYGQVNFKFKP
ncbi:MAG: hypothetical protein A2297_03545 [Elusimicrobia bacterium RIFOXYB2_FULL_48_7]|nr:MAG: hypothetical protein A2297_03545 [Elusimicrobia bacterium RIFOXYB2_FULL_48_7]